MYATTSDYVIFNYVCVSVELELQTVVSYPIKILVTELFARAVFVLWSHLSNPHLDSLLRDNTVSLFFIGLPLPHRSLGIF